MSEGIIQLIDEDLDLVAGGDLNIADIDQFIRQVQIFGRDNDQAAENLAVVAQRNA